MRSFEDQITAFHINMVNLDQEVRGLLFSRKLLTNINYIMISQCRIQMNDTSTQNTASVNLFYYPGQGRVSLLSST